MEIVPIFSCNQIYPTYACKCMYVCKFIMKCKQKIHVVSCTYYMRFIQIFF